MTERKALWRRRAALTFGAVAVAGWVIGIPRLADVRRTRLQFRDLPGLAPFRALDTAGAVSAGAVLLTGLDASQPQDALRSARIAEVRADPCAALFGQTPDPRLPIAFFSDFNCPNCRVLSATLGEALAAQPESLRLVRHELPLLGTASTVASKAVLAADLQGGYEVMHDRLMRSRMVTDLNLVASMATAVGLDGGRLVADMQAPQIADALDRADAIAGVFGLWGTPATVIGRTVFLGTLSAGDVARIIEDELAALPMDCPRPRA